MMKGNSGRKQGLRRSAVFAGMMIVMLATCSTAAQDASAAKNDDAEAEAGEAAKQKQLERKSQGEAKITADSADINFKKQEAVFKGNVRVKDKNMILNSDKMNVRFAGSNKLKSVVATGNVTITQLNRDRKAHAGRAKYDVKTRRLVLTENPVVKTPNYVLENTPKIIFYPDEERVTTSGTKSERPKLRFDSGRGSGLLDSADDKENKDTEDNGNE